MPPACAHAADTWSATALPFKGVQPVRAAGPACPFGDALLVVPGRAEPVLERLPCTDCLSDMLGTESCVETYLDIPSSLRLAATIIGRECIAGPLGSLACGMLTFQMRRQVALLQATDALLHLCARRCRTTWRRTCRAGWRTRLPSWRPATRAWPPMRPRSRCGRGQVSTSWAGRSEPEAQESPAALWTAEGYPEQQCA